jgi:hypothetical protein
MYQDNHRPNGKDGDVMRRNGLHLTVAGATNVLCVCHLNSNNALEDAQSSKSSACSCSPYMLVCVMPNIWADSRL